MCTYRYDQGYIHERCMQKKKWQIQGQNWKYHGFTTKGEKKEIEPADLVKDNARCTLHLFQDSCLITIV